MGGQRLSGYYGESMGANPIFRFFTTIESWNPTVLRLFLGGIFLFHGCQQAFGLFGGAGWEQSIKTMDAEWGMPFYLSASSIVAEVLGAVGLILGFFTRLSGLALFFVIGLSIAYVKWRHGFESMEQELLQIGIALALVFSGGGNLSLDKELSKQLLP